MSKMTREQAVSILESLLSALDIMGMDGDRYNQILECIRILSPSPRKEPPTVVNDVMDELRKAVSKFPSWPSDPFHALAIIGEEFGELQQSFLKAHYENGNGADRQEAVQLAAMAIRFLMHWEDYEVKDTTQVKSALPMPKGTP